MGVTAIIFEVPKHLFDGLKRSELYTTYDFLQANPPLEESDLYLKTIDIGRDWGEIDGVFKDEGEPLKYIIEGDYHHPAGIEQGIDPGGYYYEGFVTPETVKHISSVLKDGYPQDTIIKKLSTLGLTYDSDYDGKMLNSFQLVFDFYKEVAKRNNAIGINLF